MIGAQAGEESREQVTEAPVLATARKKKEPKWK